MAKKKVTNLAMLEEEIIRLRHKSRGLENQLGERMDHLKSNYKSMAMNTVIPGVANSGVLGFVGKIAGSALKSGSVKSMLTSALMTAAEFIAVRFGIKLFNNIKQRKSRKKAAATGKEA
ncbi:hypothetical protein GFS24_15520 [Chitinophaga sp. SYP-B3965]|uniref:hypothetical protein n=1 Tax=Chitinophaga sp. SYP-B3965 TaxID=2663120 RepID=UPI001299AE1E|nr:hypothetical protein [Chitinophaga sp. SYP-B3965]MRG46531.1 hypothetical protein [Chitinophaga sp. SYP-B3965]